MVYIYDLHVYPNNMKYLPYICVACMLSSCWGDTPTAEEDVPPSATVEQDPFESLEHDVDTTRMMKNLEHDIEGARDFEISHE